MTKAFVCPKYDKPNFRMMAMDQKGFNGPSGQRPPHPWLEGRLEEPRWPDDWIFRLHIFAGLAAFTVILFLVFGQRLFRDYCMSCCITNKVLRFKRYG